MEHRLALLGLYLALVACADTGEQARPVFSASNEVARTIAYAPYGEGKQNLAAGQYGLAIERFMAAYRRDPYDVGVLNAIGITYDSLGRRDLARRYLERALALDPSSPVTLNNLGRCWMNDGNWQIAVTYLQRAQALDGADRRIATN